MGETTSVDETTCVDETQEETPKSYAMAKVMEKVKRRERRKWKAFDAYVEWRDDLGLMPSLPNSQAYDEYNEALKNKDKMKLRQIYMENPHCFR